MGSHAVHDLDPREKRFFTANLRRGATESWLVKTLALAMCMSWTVALIALVDSPGSMIVRLAIILGVACLMATIVAAFQASNSKVRDALLAIDRCGECGHKLHGTARPLARGIRTKTCYECGTVWTDLDRRDSISSLYGCA